MSNFFSNKLKVYKYISILERYKKNYQPDLILKKNKSLQKNGKNFFYK